MKSPLRKLGLGFGLHPRRPAAGSAAAPVPPAANEDDLLHAAQDLIDMRNCYDSFLSAAAATANSAYEFSEALREMGTCLFARMTSIENDQAGKVFLMLGKAQFQLQKLMDTYRVNVLSTITAPSESLLRELQIVEDMKRQCDDKKQMYDSLLNDHKEKSRSKHAKSENVTLEQLKQVHEDYQEEAALFLFRLKSLKQGQFRSLLTQAARHHAAQLNFFRKSSRSLEVVEPHVKSAAEKQHIDYHFKGLEDDAVEEDNDDAYDDSRDGELSFDYRGHDQMPDVDNATRHSMELDVNVSATAVKNEMDSFDISRVDPPFLGEKHRPSSQSAPLFAEKHEPSEKLKELKRSSTRKFCSYALPTPSDVLNPSASGISLGGAHLEKRKEWTRNNWHPTPLELNNLKDFRENKLPSPTRLPTVHSVLKESNANSIPSRAKPPSKEEPTLLESNARNASDPKKMKREKGWTANTSTLLTSQRRSSTSQPLGHIAISPSTSPPPISSPRISELHELPLPPVSSTTAARHSYSSIHHSAPLVSKNQENWRPSRTPHNATLTASPQPTPTVVMSRSYSIPSRSMPTDPTVDEVHPASSSLAQGHILRPSTALDSSRQVSKT